MSPPGQAGARARSRLAVAGIAALAGIVLAPLGWVVSDHLEQDNDFCNSCHLEPGVPLHRELRRDFDSPRAVNLASVHGGSRVAGRDDARFRCIDCHGGASLAGRARVKALAAKDAFWYLVGRFEEPDGMNWPLWDEDCRKCHSGFDATPSEAWESPRFHELAVHNADLGLDCVECHRVHEAGGNPEAFFLHVTQVQSQCVRCHPEFVPEFEGG